MTAWWLAAEAALAGAAAVRAHDFFEGERLLPDLLDEARLLLTDLAELDTRCAANPRRSDAVVSMTTIPSRLPWIGLTLKSLMRQTRAPAEIRLNLPAHSRREGRPYEVPDWLRRLRSVRIVPCEDWGPATKLLPTLRDCAPDQPIVVVDDDRVYLPTVLEALETAAAARPDAAHGLSGWVVPADLVDRPTTLWTNLGMLPPAPIRAPRLRAPREVDILQGLSGYIVRPRFFDLDRVTDYGGAPPAAFFVDDVWISAHCRAPKYLVPARDTNYPPRWRKQLMQATSLGRLNRGGGDHELRNNTLLLKHLGSVWRIGGPRGRG